MIRLESGNAIWSDGFQTQAYADLFEEKATDKKPGSSTTSEGDLRRTRQRLCFMLVAELESTLTPGAPSFRRSLLSIRDF
jgi:hypothetical protein